MPAGRPTKYRPEMCDTIIELGKTGAGRAEMATEIDICRDTFNEWTANNPQFSDAVKLALQHSQSWWEQQGRLATFGGTDGFNATSYIFNMKNRFPDEWRDKKEVDVNLSHEQALDELDG